MFCFNRSILCSCICSLYLCPMSFLNIVAWLSSSFIPYLFYFYLCSYSNKTNTYHCFLVLLIFLMSWDPLFGEIHFVFSSSLILHCPKHAPHTHTIYLLSLFSLSHSSFFSHLFSLSILLFRSHTQANQHIK